MDPEKLLAAEFSPEEHVTTGKWFGEACLKVGGKVFAVLSDGDMAFKLAGEAHREALAIEGTGLFDPRGKGRPMKAWVLVPAAASITWKHYARLACEWVAGEAEAKKDELIKSLVEARRAVLEAASSLPLEMQDSVFMGVWSVKDLLAHLVGWDHTNRTAVEQILANQRPTFWQHYDRDWASYNAMLVAEYRREDFGEMIAATGRSHRELIVFLRAIPADEFITRGQIARLLRAEAKDEQEHSRQIMAFKFDQWRG